MAEVIYKGNDHVIELQDLKDGSTGTIIPSATVSCTLRDSTNTPVTGQTWPISMDPVVGTPGTYRGILEDDLSLLPGAIYTAEILVDAGSDLKGRWDILMQAD